MSDFIRRLRMLYTPTLGTDGNLQMYGFCINFAHARKCVIPFRICAECHCGAISTIMEDGAGPSLSTSGGGTSHTERNESDSLKVTLIAVIQADEVQLYFSRQENISLGHRFQAGTLICILHAL